MKGGEPATFRIDQSRLATQPDSRDRAVRVQSMFLQIGQRLLDVVPILGSQVFMKLWRFVRSKRDGDRMNWRLTPLASA